MANLSKITCKYCDNDETQTLNKRNHKEALTFFHIDTCSRTKKLKVLNISLVKQKLKSKPLVNHGLLHAQPYMSHLKAKIKRPVFKRSLQKKKG